MIKVLKNVASTWRRQGSGADIALILRSRLGSERAFELVKAAVSRVDLTDGEGDVVSELRVGPVDGGIGIWFSKCDELKLVLDRFVEALVAVGVEDATIGVLPFANIGISSVEDIAFLKCVWLLRAEPIMKSNQVDDSLPDILAGWSVARADLLEVADFLARWVLGLAGANQSVFLSPGAQFSAVSRGVAAGLFGEAVERGAGSIVRLLVRAGDRFRTVAISTQAGYAAAAEGTIDVASFAWEQSLSDMTELLVAAPEAARSGYITRGKNWGTAGVGFTLHATEPLVPSWVPQMPYRRHVVEQDHVLDAFALFMRRDPPLPTNLDSSQWRVWEPRSGTTLVRHRLPDRWLSQSAVDEPTRDKARASLAQIMPPMKA